MGSPTGYGADGGMSEPLSVAAVKIGQRTTSSSSPTRFCGGELRGREGRWHIDYNPHHPGRFAVVDDHDNPICVSNTDIVVSSPEARHWIDGYVRGCEPDANRMLGDAIWDVDDSDPRRRRWCGALAEFRRTGERRPEC
jgi:hypothetical protein